MDKDTKQIWLKRVLFLKLILTFFAWGLPALFANAAFLNFFNLSIPEDPIYLRLFGAACTAFGLAYWFAFREPQPNRSVIQAGIADNVLITLAVIGVSINHGINSWYIYASAAFTTFFALAFIFLLPTREKGAW